MCDRMQMYNIINLSSLLPKIRGATITQYSYGLRRDSTSTSWRPALEPTKPPIQWVPDTYSPRVKLRMCEAGHSPLSNAKVKIDGAVSPAPPHVFMAWSLNQVQGQLYHLTINMEAAGFCETLVNIYLDSARVRECEVVCNVKVLSASKQHSVGDRMIMNMGQSVD
jgi:hypothetical protein